MEKVSTLSKTIKYYGPVIVWAILIYSVSSTPVPKVSSNFTVDFSAHKIAHVLEYAFMAILLYRAIKQEKISKPEAAIYAIIITMFYGFTDEFHQSFTSGRTTRLRDVFIDTIGASVGILIVWKLLPKAPKKLLRLAKELDLL